MLRTTAALQVPYAVATFLFTIVYLNFYYYPDMDQFGFAVANLCVDLSMAIKGPLLAMADKENFGSLFKEGLKFWKALP